MRVVVCLSNSTNRVVAQALLEKHGFATYGCDVHELTNFARGIEPDVILLDAPMDQKTLSELQDLSDFNVSIGSHLVTFGAEQSRFQEQISCFLKPVANISRPFDIDAALEILTLLSHDRAARAT